jgi:hypothetical protein
MKVQTIKYLSRQQIDNGKWNNCIEKAPNGLIYAYSYYLDQMAVQWDALVTDDYEIVMPLTWNKKYGIYYLYQPFLTAQLGVFGKEITQDTVEQFLRAIPPKFRYWDIYLNHANVFNLQNFKLYQRSNYVLDLAKPYQEIYKEYRENIRRNIRKAEQAGCKLQKDFGVEKVIDLAWRQMKGYGKESKVNVERFSKLYKRLRTDQMAVTYGITLGETLIASCVFFYSHNRAYYILVGNHPNGKTIGASHALIDAFIKDHAGKQLLLDFEGSDIRNLAFFYSSFGAVEEKFAGIRLNKLPFYLKWSKK